MEMRLSNQDKQEIAILRNEHEQYADSLTPEEIKKEYINLRANQEWLMRQTLKSESKLRHQESINFDLNQDINYYLDELAEYGWEGGRVE